MCGSTECPCHVMVTHSKGKQCQDRKSRDLLKLGANKVRTLHQKMRHNRRCVSRGTWYSSMQRYIRLQKPRRSKLPRIMSINFEEACLFPQKDNPTKTRLDWLLSNPGSASFCTRKFFVTCDKTKRKSSSCKISLFSASQISRNYLRTMLFFVCSCVLSVCLFGFAKSSARIHTLCGCTVGRPTPQNPTPTNLSETFFLFFVKSWHIYNYPTISTSEGQIKSQNYVCRCLPLNSKK